ncbi:MAG: glutamate racemase [Nitrosopumilaceae archaeon]
MVKIAVFDSGFGSLSIIKQIRKKIKAEIIYFADQENFPYGKKSISELREIINKTISTLKKEFKPDVIVVGSNTPSILLGGYKSSKIIGVYPPLKEASKKTRTSSIAILSTQNVIKSKALDDLIRKNVFKKVKILKINASPLVELVESGKFIDQKQYCINTIKSLLLKPLEDNQVDVVTLSSTHLPFIYPLLHQLFPKIEFLDPANSIVTKILKTHNLQKTKSTFTIYSSGKITRFQKQLNKIRIKRKVKILKIH